MVECPWITINGIKIKRFIFQMVFVESRANYYTSYSQRICILTLFYNYRKIKEKDSKRWHVPFFWLKSRPICT